MSGREPLWFCHECHAEMRPLMVPDPVCASCHGSFVEKMENPSDDPRQFAHDDGDFDGGDGTPPGMDTFLLSLQSLMDRGLSRDPNQRPTTGPSVTFEVRGPGGSRTVRLGGSNTLGGGNNDGTLSRPTSPGAVPNMSTYLRSGPFGIPQPPPNGQDRATITGPLMAQYLMALLGYHDPAMMLGVPANGRMGDYVFNQEALDQIITQIMESSSAHPVPATEEIIAKLPREVLLEGSPTLELDCAVCKEQFKAAPEDPDEAIVVTLPCKHPFHEPCIIPWLKSSGTCPVCRYALIPQPEYHPPPGADSGSGGNGRRPGSSPGPSNQPGSGTPRGPESGGLFQAIFGGLTGHHGNNNQSNRSSSNSGRNGNGSRSPTSPQQRPNQPEQEPSHRRSNSDPASSSRPTSPSYGRRNRNNGNNRHGDNVPGSWSEDLD